MSNIYAKLAELPQETADKITNAKTAGGRSLEAFHNLPDYITPCQAATLSYIGSRMTYTYEKFDNQYQFVSLSKIARATKFSISAILRGINGYTDKRKANKIYKGLIELGYLVKEDTPKVKQLKEGIPNAYALTSKAFDDYINLLIEKELSKSSLQNFRNELNQKLNTENSNIAQRNTPTVNTIGCNSSHSAAQYPYARSAIPNIAQRATSSVEDSVEDSVKNKIQKQGFDADDLNNINMTMSITTTLSSAKTNNKDNNNVNSYTNNNIHDFKKSINNINNNSVGSSGVSSTRISRTSDTSNSHRIDRIDQNVLATRKKRLMHNVKTLHKIAVSQNSTTFVAFETIESIAAKFFEKYESKLDLVASFLDDSIAQNKTVPVAKLESSFLAYESFTLGKDTATQAQDTSSCKDISENDLNVATSTKEAKAISHSQELACLSKNDLKTNLKTQPSQPAPSQTIMLNKQAKVINMIVSHEKKDKTNEEIELEKLKEKHSIFELKEKLKINYILPQDLKEFFKSLNNLHLVKNIMRSDGVRKTAKEFEEFYRYEAAKIAEREKSNKKESIEQSFLKNA